MHEKPEKQAHDKQEASSPGEDNLSLMFGEEETRIVIRNGQVMIENLTRDMLDVAVSLNPEDASLLARKRQSEM
ncbi:MAG: hypothetical protein FWC40_00915 [Proteobacteria bacterium]|nr:hypothetical protein [Pseudomonadota bacterium]